MGRNKRFCCRWAHQVEVTRDIFPSDAKLHEEPAMGKKLRKSEKLDLILSELANLSGEVKKLVRDRAAVRDQGVKAKPRSAAKRPKKLAQRTVAGKKPDRDVAPSKSGLVQAPQVPRPTNRTASHALIPPQPQTDAHGSTPAQSSRKPR